MTMANCQFAKDAKVGLRVTPSALMLIMYARAKISTDKLGISVPGN